MALVTYKALCIDAVDAAVLGEFWAKALSYELELLADGDAVLRGPGEGEEVWLNTVPEAKSVWHRVHLDIRAASLKPFADLRQVSGDGEFPWTTFADPEDGEFCVFTYDPPPERALKDIVVQALDHTAISDWWTDVIGGTIGHDDKSDYSHIDDIPGSTLESIDFVPTEEPKTVKNRLHWDVALNDGVTIDDLVTVGATVLHTAEDEIPWTVMPTRRATSSASSTVEGSA